MGTLTAASDGILPSERTTYLSSGTYTFKISLAHDIPSGGMV